MMVTNAQKTEHDAMGLPAGEEGVHKRKSAENGFQQAECIAKCLTLFKIIQIQLSHPFAHFYPLNCMAFDNWRQSHLMRRLRSIVSNLEVSAIIKGMLRLLFLLATSFEGSNQ